MSKLAPLLDLYEESHRHPVNVAIHWIAEPLAILALMALAASVKLTIGTLLWPFLTALMIYFARLSPRFAMAFVPMIIVFVAGIWAMGFITGYSPTWHWALPLFVSCWVALLIGHKIEGRVPSVLQNPHLIFVGPAWLMRIIFRRIGWSDL